MRRHPVAPPRERGHSWLLVHFVRRRHSMSTVVPVVLVAWSLQWYFLSKCSPSLWASMSIVLSSLHLQCFF